MAIIISGVTFLIQQATFAGVFRPFHAINTLPATISARGSPADQGRTLGSLKLPSGDAEWLKTRESLELMDPSLADPARRIQRALEKQKELASLRNQFGEFVLEAKVLDAKLEEARKQFSKISEMEKAAEVAAPSHGTQGESAHDAETTLAERAERLHKLRGQLKDLTAQAEDAVKKLSTLVRSSYLSLGLQPLARPLTASEQAEFDRVVNSVQEGRRRLNSDLTSQIAIFKKMQHELEEFDEKSLRPAELAMVQLAARSLELCLTGSLGFWVTIGLLAGWSVARGRHPQEFPTKGAERSG